MNKINNSNAIKNAQKISQNTLKNKKMKISQAVVIFYYIFAPEVQRRCHIKAPPTQQTHNSNVSPTMFFQVFISLSN